VICYAGNGDRILVFLLMELLKNNQSLVRGIPLMSKSEQSALLAGNYGHFSDMIFYSRRLGYLHYFVYQFLNMPGKGHNTKVT